MGAFGAGEEFAVAVADVAGGDEEAVEVADEFEEDAAAVVGRFGDDERGARGRGLVCNKADSGTTVLMGGVIWRGAGICRM